MASTADSFAALMQIPGLQELLNTQITSARQQEPLRTGATQTALGMLPNSSFGGSSARPDVSAIPRANFATPAPSGSSGLAQALKYIAAAGAGAAGANALSGGNALKAIIDGIKKLTGRGGGGVNPYGPMGDFGFNGYDFWNGMAGDPSGGTGRGPGLDGLDTSGLRDFGGLNIPEIGGGQPNGLPGSGSWPALANPDEE